ncbi:hypothetical protein [Halanaerobium kushneri]|uniref:Uncharacterized protein n=1 Tax=Halanaerobium kushneri TaxID=56779 RepID=A0A1N7BP78_9FIRM|nr:hypothetical protein [Halanaerobium kushneri]SIR53128.1 hypothetical protein SAMN05421834_13317 [Halanaerobium kushneri]
MKKLLILSLALLFVMSISGVIIAAEANVGVNVTVSPYMDVWFVPADESDPDYLGLFGNDALEIGEPGIYISDGNATKNSVLSIWDPVKTAAETDGITSFLVLQDYFSQGQLPAPQVEKFKVDANTNVNVTLSANFDDWMNAPTIFRVSSDDTDINGIGDWATDLALVGNTVDMVSNAVYNPALTAHNNAVTGLNDTFSLDFANTYLCHGPLEFHLNGALWIPKASQVAADDYSATVIVTVSAVGNGS